MVLATLILQTLWKYIANLFKEGLGQMKQKIHIGINLFLGVFFGCRFFLYMYFIHPTASFKISSLGWHYDALKMLCFIYTDCFITGLILLIVNLKGYSEVKKKFPDKTFFQYFFRVTMWSIIPVSIAFVGGLAYGIL